MYYTVPISVPMRGSPLPPVIARDNRAPTLVSGRGPLVGVRDRARRFKCFVSAATEDGGGMERSTCAQAARGHVTLRPAEPADEAFLYEVYASTRVEELAPLPWDDAQKQAFLTMQCAAQHRHYHTYYADASFQIILRDGAPAGRLYVADQPAELRLLDIALLPAARGAGVGTALIADLLAAAVRAHKAVRLHVDPHNPASRLYHRLGFTPVAAADAGAGPYLFMEWVPPVEARA